MDISDVKALPEDARPALIELADSSVSAGFPSPAQDYATTEIDLNTHLMKNRVSCYLMRVSGDSMQGVGIWSGDEIIVDCSVRPEQNDIIVVTVDGEMLVKRWTVRDGQVWLLAENDAYPPLAVEELSDVRVWGVVTFGIRHVVTRRV